LSVRGDGLENTTEEVEEKFHPEVPKAQIIQPLSDAAFFQQAAPQFRFSPPRCPSRLCAFEEDTREGQRTVHAHRERERHTCAALELAGLANKNGAPRPRQTLC